jgi:hypothetical protein
MLSLKDILQRTYISMKIEPKGKMPPSTTITPGSMNLKYKKVQYLKEAQTGPTLKTAYNL